MRPVFSLARAGPAPPSAVGDGGGGSSSKKDSSLPRLHRLASPSTPSSPSRSSRSRAAGLTASPEPSKETGSAQQQQPAVAPSASAAAAASASRSAAAFAYAQGLFSKFRGNESASTSASASATMTAPASPIAAAHPSSQPSISSSSTSTSTSSSADASSSPLQQPDLRRFLRPTGDSETRYIRMLSSLCAQTYYIEKLNSRTLWRRHRLELVSTSRACELRGARGGPLAQQRVSPSGFSSAGYSSGSPRASAPSSPGRGALLLTPEREEREAFEDALGDSDAMAASPAQAAAAATAAEAAASLADAGAPPTDALAAAALARVQAADAPPAAVAAEVVAVEETALVASSVSPTPSQPVRLSATDLVASRLAAAAQAAAAAAAPLASAAGSAVGSAASAAASNVGSLAAAAGAAAPEPLRVVAGAAAAGAAGVAGNLPLRAVAGSLQSAAAAGHSTAVATIALVTAAVQSTWGSSGEASKLNGGSGLDSDLDDGGACASSPTEWFVADDPGSHTRYFIIQGSDTLDHWKVNLTFEPVPFEDPDLGVKVHRGVYEAALRLYDRFLPLVVEHVALSPFAKVVFAGHSLGGSLGTLLMLMFLRRGVLPPVALSPAYTFGAPAVLCDAAAWGSVSPSSSSSSSAAPSSLLSSSPTLVKTPLSNDPATRPRGCPVCGAPAGDCLHSATGPCAAAVASSSSSSPGGLAFRPPAPLLERLCLPPGAVRNVVMARDIVPRAFTCDYSSVAGVLWAAGGAFRGLECLHTPASAAAAEEEAAVAAAAGRSVLAAAVERASSEKKNTNTNGSKEAPANALFSSASTRQVMYTFIGRLVVLQPDASHAFVKGERERAGHPLLPPGPGLYTLREPALLPGSGASGGNNIAPLVRGGGKRVVVGSGGGTSSSSSSSGSGGKSLSSSWKGGSSSLATPPPRYAPARLRPVRSVSAAVAALMDQPHPLEMLADKASYGDDGAISRYHNPDHYTQAVGGVLRARMGSSRWRPLAELAEVGRGEPAWGQKEKESSSSSSSPASAPVPAPAPTVPPPSPFLARLSPAMRPQLGRGGGTTVIRARPSTAAEDNKGGEKVDGAES